MPKSAQTARFIASCSKPTVDFNCPAAEPDQHHCAAVSPPPTTSKDTARPESAQKASTPPFFQLITQYRWGGSPFFGVGAVGPPDVGVKRARDVLVSRLGEARQHTSLKTIASEDQSQTAACLADGHTTAWERGGGGISCQANFAVANLAEKVCGGGQKEAWEIPQKILEMLRCDVL
mmetsp:Transcript_101383/g.171610  ORF Transcript_101383/g.171610 Transcript_101383/m.171610 type:complete len:177 (-) Transcript_101383:1459-1989(-)|eukprot:CAMPEP_0174351958 /NCGR_PEP_ID=MMETSP0811_2-20130205/9495_1 /TAXON_ID=73025 ORGANISM="Eutreptiella gymnastica-like, Strain CCMP1594" /NCGR_SAMPLE_ID=MMETSP0811_2 /ASSEMBLY_ACC=CAM_ASM_000667 /LENGTH=176 /DNA_ID=CAMNT_0015481711 /DNA_START=167 /DNA_END=697 /DNA_ORIENTATION=-